MEKETPIMMNVADVAKLLGVSLPTAYKLTRSDGFPHISVGKRVLIPRAAFLQWIEENSRKEKA